jgi:hypothetical protein
MTIKELEDEFSILGDKNDFTSIKVTLVDQKDKILEILKRNFPQNRKAVLGIDIYQYSQYETEKQVLIPILFEFLIDETKRWCKMYEQVIFANFNLDSPYIDTGDGGFFVFDDPLQAIVFNIYFHTHLRTYNTGHYYQSIFNYLGEIILRTCITYDTTYSFKSNTYGSAIINNARIMSRDKLNRFIIDENTYSWFNVTIGGIENMKVAPLNEIYNGLIEEVDTKGRLISESSRIINHSRTIKMEPQPVENIHIQKIGTILIKKNEVSVYNLEIQVKISISDDEKPEYSMLFVTTIGNLNTEGIS